MWLFLTNRLLELHLGNWSSFSSVGNTLRKNHTKEPILYLTYSSSLNVYECMHIFFGVCMQHLRIFKRKGKKLHGKRWELVPFHKEKEGEQQGKILWVVLQYRIIPGSLFGQLSQDFQCRLTWCVHRHESLFLWESAVAGQNDKFMLQRS